MHIVNIFAAFCAILAIIHNLDASPDTL